MRPFTLVIIMIGLLAGALLALVAVQVGATTTAGVFLLSLGSGLVATAFISVVLDLFWSKERARAEKAELQPFYDKFAKFADQLEKLEGRLEAFKQLGLNYCHAARSHALARFLAYAREIVETAPTSDDATGELPPQSLVNIVSSSARGLMGYLDRQPHEVQREWRDLITAHPQNFRILLTHPAYAHLRQPAEERSSGDIELEILKTAIYLHCVAGMKSRELRFYRGSPTVFAIQAHKHILLNPYPYGKMAMDTLCLEFESEGESSYVGQFVSMHFSHTWAFIHQPSKLVDGKPLVVGVEDFSDILDAFSECTELSEPKRLRLTEAQVDELDVFIGKLVVPKPDIKIRPPGEAPFMSLIREKELIPQRSWIQQPARQS